MTSSDEDVNIVTISFCLIFIPSGSGFSGFTYIEIDRSINRSGAMIAPYARVDYKVSSRVVFSSNI